MNHRKLSLGIAKCSPDQKSAKVVLAVQFSQTTSSGWDQIFPDKAMTVAAIDRLVHHATILEMNAESFRQREAALRRKAQTDLPETSNKDNSDEGKT